MNHVPTFHENLRSKMDEFVHFVYGLTRSFPREELYGVTSQLRRASPSIILNYIEGYARKHEHDKVHRNFLEISYGSLKETQYLLDFSCKEKYLTEADYQRAAKSADEIGAMLWSTFSKMESKS